MTSGHWVSIGLFALVVGLGALRPRFWCRYLCPTGAVFSLGSLLRLTGRRVEPECIACGKCDAACSFDAVMSDFTTHPANCAFCQVCAGVCPTQAVSFRLRWTRQELSASEEPTGPKAPASTSPVPQAASVGRRGFLAAGLGVLAGCAGGSTTAAAIRATGAQTGAGATFLPVRPPGSLPEDLFLKMCVRCGECLQACPNDVLQPLQFEQGLEGLWTPHVVADWSGCEASCNNCGKVCPTGAIRDLPLDEKKVARMGLAVIDQKTCLPLAGREECRLCADECTRAGYNAIHFERVGTEVDEFGNPVEGSGFTAPVIQPEACVGCGLCQTRCRAINVVSKGLLAESAIVVEAGPGKEDRMVDGSYVTLREQERVEREKQRRERIEGDDGSYLPDFLQ